MSISYKSCTETTEAIHACDPCNQAERARVRSVILIKPGTTIPSPLTKAGMEALMEAGNIIVLPKTSGSLEDTPKEGTGYGDDTKKILGHDYVLNFKDPSYASNSDFYSQAEKKPWYCGWRTESLLYLNMSKTATLEATEPIEDNLDSDVTWNGKLSWSSTTKPTKQAITPIVDIFKCYEVDDDDDTNVGGGQQQ